MTNKQTLRFNKLYDKAVNNFLADDIDYVASDWASLSEYLDSISFNPCDHLTHDESIELATLIKISNKKGINGYR